MHVFIKNYKGEKVLWSQLNFDGYFYTVSTYYFLHSKFYDILNFQYIECAIYVDIHYIQVHNKVDEKNQSILGIGKFGNLDKLYKIILYIKISIRKIYTSVLYIDFPPESATSCKMFIIKQLTSLNYQTRVSRKYRTAFMKFGSIN